MATYNLGRVKGAMWYVGSAASDAAITAELSGAGHKPLEQDCYLNLSTGDVYQYEKTSSSFGWGKKGNIKGPQGAQGASGGKGDKGDKGDKGEPGSNGATGESGLSIWYSSAPASNSTTSIAQSTITIPSGRSIQIGDLVVAGGYLLFRVTTVAATLTVVYLTSIRGATGATGSAGANGTNGTNGKDGKTPTLSISDGCLFATYD